MAIDYIIEYSCPPKNALTAAGILERIKERQRAQEVIQWFRAAGDDRPPTQMGFEFSRSAPGQPSETQLIVVQDLLDHAAALDAHAEHCRSCPANRGLGAYGCLGFLRYPISARAETWLLERLPVPDEPLLWLLLRQGIRTFGYDGASVKALREMDSANQDGGRTYFELSNAPQRRFGQVRVSGDQALEMIFGVGPRIVPNHAGILLLFFNAIERDLEAAEIQAISSAESLPGLRERLAFKMADSADFDDSIRDFIAFFRALHSAWQLNVPLYIDA